MKHKNWGELLQVGSKTSLAREKHGQQGQDDRQGPNTKRDNFLRIFALTAASFACGMVTSQRGPSILDLGHVSHSGLLATLGMFALGAGGYLAGCMATGVLLSRLNAVVFLFWALLAMSGVTAVLPWCGQYAAMATLYFFSLLTVGCVETGSYAMVAKRWRSHGGAIVQLMQLSFVVGGVVSPGMTQFFLMPRPHEQGEQLPSDDDKNSTAQLGSDFTGLTSEDEEAQGWYNGFSSNSSHKNGSVVDGSGDVRITHVQNAYIVTAAVAFIVAIAFIAIHVLKREDGRFAEGMPCPHHVPRTASPTAVHAVRDANVPALLLVAAFFVMVSGVEESFHQFLFTFLVHEDHWSTHMAGWVTSWFWCGVFLVRLVHYFLPDVVADDMVLILSCTLLPCTLAGLQASVTFSSSDGVWACVFFIGMASSLILPVSFTWLHSSLGQRSSAVSMVVMISSSVAGVVNPILLAHMFRNGSADGFPYVLMVEACLALMIFLVLNALSKKLTATGKTVSTRNTIEEVFLDKFEEIHEDSDKGDENHS